MRWVPLTLAMADDYTPTCISAMHTKEGNDFLRSRAWTGLKNAPLAGTTSRANC